MLIFSIVVFALVGLGIWWHLQTHKNADDDFSIESYRPGMRHLAKDFSRAGNTSIKSAQRLASAPPLTMDEMRNGLQKVAYEMVGNAHDAETKARFKQVMTEFASLDPLVKEIVTRVRSLVDASPGLLQSGIYSNLPGYSKEQVRYALYFAHELGLVFRKKKGRSYQLFPPGDTVDSSVL